MLPHFIAGKHHAGVSGKTFENLAPTDDEVLCNVAAGGAAEIDLAAKAAKAAFPAWRAMSGGDRKQLGKILLKQKAVTAQELEEILDVQKGAPGTRLASAALKSGKVEEVDLLRALSEQHGVPGIDLTQVVVPAQNLRLVPHDVAKQYLILPFSVKEIYAQAGPDKGGGPVAPAAPGAAGAGISGARVMHPFQDEKRFRPRYGSGWTFVLAALVLLLALASRRRAWPELAWLVYPLVTLAGLKLLLQDLPVGRPFTLVLSLSLYGVVLLLAPRLLKQADRAGG